FSLIFLTAAASASTPCGWSGTPSVAPPVATPLRSYPDPYGSPGRVAVDYEGNLYATDTRAGKVLVWDPDGILIFESQNLGSPTALAVSTLGNVYVGEQYSGSVLVFDPEWSLQGKLGLGDGEFLVPNDISVDSVSGDIYVSDGLANEIRVYYATGDLRTSFGGLGTEDQQFRFPSAVHVTAAGEVLVSDQNSDKVKVFDLDGNFKRCFGSRNQPSFSRKFGRISGLTTDTLGRFYVADAFHGNVQVFDSQGAKLTTIGSFGNAPGQLRTPLGLVIDPFNRLFVGSVNTGRLEFFGLDAFSDPQPEITIPAAPSSLVATAVSRTQIDLTWADNSNNETGFAVYRQVGGSWIQIDTTLNGDNSYSDSGLVESTSYSYFVQAFNSAGNTASSNHASATTFDPPPPVYLATVEFDPSEFKRNKKKDSITAIIEIPDADLELVDTSSITANGVAADQTSITFGDADQDGIPDISVEFNKQAMLAVLPDGDSAVSVTGALTDGSFFEGTAQVTVIPAKGNK
ncbi:MAG: SMP-30/gluconolactonase/LRE family protein, partial [Planctomycetales bacterium]